MLPNHPGQLNNQSKQLLPRLFLLCQSTTSHSIKKAYYSDIRAYLSAYLSLLKWLWLIFVKVRLIIYCMILLYSLLILLLGQAKAGTITSNIPIVVSSTKNYTSTAPQWITSPYFRAGNEAVIKVLTGNDKTPTYTFTFSSALPGLPNLAYGIKNYRGNDYLGQEFYEIKKIGLSAATFTVSIQIYGVTNLWMLTVAYLAVDPTFPHHLNTFDNVPINYTAGDIVNITTMKSQLAYYTNYINYTDQADGLLHNKFTTPYSSNNIVLYMTSFWVRGSFGSNPNYYPVKFHIYTGIVNESFYFWNATLETQVLVTNVHFSQIIFNSDDVESSKKYFIVYETWINDMNGGFIDIPQAFIDNFIMGVTAFETMDAHCGFQYQWQFANSTINGTVTFGVELLLSWTLTNTCGFQWSLSSIFYMETWLCPAPYYYFNLTSGMCQTLCGGFNYQNTVNFTCEPCVNTLCYECSDPTHNLCTDCASYLFYELVNNTCSCMSGYFPTSDLCMPCKNASTGCLTCTYSDGANGTLAYNSSKFQCIACNNTANYFLNGRLCQLCTLSNCVTCLNLTACTTCSSTYFPSVTLLCVHCTVTGCAYCSDSSSSNCSVCNLTLGYYLSGKICVTKCGDGIITPGVEQCDDNNTASYDGCSSACSTQSSFSCSGVPSMCYFVSSASIALTNTIIETTVCDTITFTFQLTPVTTTFSQSYVNWTDFILTPNSSLITLNSSMVKYSSGKLNVSYSMRATIQNLTVTFTTDYLSLIANSTIFNQTTSNSLSFAVAPTNNHQALLECCTGYYYNTNIHDCSEICGDGFVYVLPCDDGNVINGDGCSSTCQIETDYACLNGTTTSPSVCCFNGTIQVSVSSAIKDPTSNTLSIAYTLSPIQPVLALLNNSNNFLPYISLSNPAATITSATYDPSTGTVNVQVSYNQSIQGQAMGLTFNPPNVPSASMMPTVANSWTVSPTNHLSAAFYPDSTYSQVKKIQPYSSAVLGVYLSVSMITFFFRKFIGLELATLIQIGYLSLVMNNQLPAYLQSVSAWQYVFGYNYFYLTQSSSTTLDSSYSVYGYQKYFGYSCNVMVLAIASVYGLSLLLVCLSAITTKTLSRKLKNGGFILLNEVGSALVTFSTPNIITALCIQVQAGTIFDASIFWSKAFLCVGVVAIILSNIIGLINADESSDVGTFFRMHSKLGIYASILFNLRLISLTIFIFVNQYVGSVGSYFLLTIQCLYLIFVGFGRPHKKPYDFIRSLILEFSLLYILFTRYLETYVLNSTVSGDSLLFQILSITELATYGLGVVVSVVSLVYHIVKKFKKNKVEPNDNLLQQQSPQKVRKQSSDKLQDLSKEGSPQGSPSKRKISDQNASSIVFDIEEMDAETSGANGSTGNSSFKFDSRKQERKYRRNR